MQAHASSARTFEGELNRAGDLSDPNCAEVSLPPSIGWRHTFSGIGTACASGMWRPAVMKLDPMSLDFMAVIRDSGLAAKSDDAA
mmetsp:Transcript_154041/g.272023  ORF Transcript_154041/g.272023 Transcript_154041/m.272023 type:complete len:85 (-) Transcript_154041:1717-1971(-)